MSVVHRGTNRWAIVLHTVETDPKTGARRKRQRWVSFRGTRKDAKVKEGELLGKLKRNEYVAPNKLLVAEWLDEWLTKVVKPSMRPLTYRTFRSVVNSLKATLGDIRLQQLKPADVQAYFGARSTLAPATLHLHHAALALALKAAVKNDLVTRNVATKVDGKPRLKRTKDDLARNCWSLAEARAFIVAAKQAGPRAAALYSLALDAGMRKGELLGLQWGDVDFDDATVTVQRQLISSKLDEAGRVVFGDPKTDSSARAISINVETVRLLREHKRHQAEIKLRNRMHFADHQLVFCKEAADLTGRHDVLGTPIQKNNLDREFRRIIKSAGVKEVTLHGLRHTCASLLLQDGENMKVIQERLGHSKLAMTMDTYGHLSPGQQKQAAVRTGTLLHG